MPTKYFFLLFITLTFVLSCQSNHTHVKASFSQEDMVIIPKPVTLKLNDGVFAFNSKTKIIATTDAQIMAADILKDLLRHAGGLSLETVEQKPGDNFIVCHQITDMEAESYHLSVTGDSIVIKAGDSNGFIYAVETIRQLLPSKIENANSEIDSWVIPQIDITDAPRYQWRGLMLDLSRHFFDKDYILKTIDRLAFLKMNTLHLHLVDDQGWRLEIKQYPKLTEVGAYRIDMEDRHWNDRKVQDKSKEPTYGGFLTQEEALEIVAYAQKRGITVVPEIEMPAHVMSAIASYPYLSCFENEIQVPSGGVWPITEIYCAGKESTFEFLENVLTEVIDIFPSKYIHVGGDEATKTNWEKCPHCQRRIQSEGLADVEELQSYFIKRMEQFISGHDRILIGWDEILEGGLAPGATVMSWRGVKGGLEASEQGHDVVMTPGSHCYFDHYQGPMNAEPQAIGGYTPVSKVYEFDPIVDGMSPEQEEHVLGGQANLWSEYIPTPAHSEYMLFPRLAALSEVLWSPEEGRKWDEFTTRLLPMMDRLSEMGVHRATSIYGIREKAEVDSITGKVQVTFMNEMPGSVIRYGINEEELDSDSQVFSEPIEITATTTLKAATFKDGERVSPVFEKKYFYHKAVGKEVTYAIPWSKYYPGAKKNNMVNILRGTKNFHDGQWQAWLDKDMDVTIDLGESQSISKVSVGLLESQGPDIYFPTRIEVWTSIDGESFTSQGVYERPYQSSGETILEDFMINFDETDARYVRVKANHFDESEDGGSTWLFADEIIVE